MDDQAQPTRLGLDPTIAGGPLSSPASMSSHEAQQFATPRRQQRQEEGSMQQTPYTPQHQVQSQPQHGQHMLGFGETLYGNQPAPAFNIHHASPPGSQATAVVPSHANNLPGALQPAGGVRSIPYVGNPAMTNMQIPPIQTNAQQYTSQPPSRSGTLHAHSRSSPAGMGDGQKYIPFNQTPTQSPMTSNPKAHNLSHAPGAAASAQTPLNLTDIRSRAISDANDGDASTGVSHIYSEAATNSNYLAPFATYAFDWCKWPVANGTGAGKMAIGSYLEDPHNFIQILDTNFKQQEGTSNSQPTYGLEYTKLAEATCAYPVTRILWEPASQQKASTDLLATSGDHLRLWSLPQPTTTHTNNINRSAAINTREAAPQKLQPLALLSNSKTPEHTAPLTSLDWNNVSPKLIITSSIDTTCTIWDIPTLTAKTQLIAHDKEVFDVRFCSGSVDVFVSCGADGSVRMFDLRSLEHSTIIYEPADKPDKNASPTTSSSPSKSHTLQPAAPLLRLAASPHDAHLLATFASDSNLIRILDVRQPGTALLELHGHQGNLNSIEWHPHRRGLLASGADDSTVLVWDLRTAQNQAVIQPVNGAANAAPAATDSQKSGPFSSWRCEYEIANVSWAPPSPLTGQGGEWLGVCAGRGVWGVKL